ncbi:MAG: hypothetical protein MUF57_08500 [Gammaproteobacteria bacterium]|nr:hypothetical protein [Gammaproteobacteria bacterium]
MAPSAGCITQITSRNTGSQGVSNSAVTAGPVMKERSVATSRRPCTYSERTTRAALSTRPPTTRLPSARSRWSPATCISRWRTWSSRNIVTLASTRSNTCSM